MGQEKLGVGDLDLQRLEFSLCYLSYADFEVEQHKGKV
jgi:hypothetical protein